MIPRSPALHPQYADLTDAQLAKVRQDAYARLQAAPDRASAQQIYKEETTFVEREGIHRQRVNDPDPAVDLLILTVGAQADSPTHAALRWDARLVALVHTDESLKNAATVVNTLGLQPDQFELVSVGNGWNPSVQYRKIRDLWERRGRPARTVLDITGGYKTMSAASAVVGFIIPDARVSYLATSQQIVPSREDVQGQTVWLDSSVELLTNPYDTFGDLDRERARSLLRGGQFAAAAREWTILSRRSRMRSDEWRASLARALDLANRISFLEAADLFDSLRADIEQDLQVNPSLGHDPLTGALTELQSIAAGQRALHQVAGGDDPARDREKLVADGMLDLVGFLLAAAERRLADGEVDLAALYAYRAMEAIPQRRLATRGFNPVEFDWLKLEQMVDPSRWPKVKKAVTDDGTRPLLPKVDRSTALQVLAIGLDDPLVTSQGPVKKLIGLGESRNRSILAHGLSRVSEKVVRDLADQARSMFHLLMEQEGLSAAQIAAIEARSNPFTLARHA